mmetsp:Transcript_65554/g.211450  ORF Transcript_65554/g.211450 Transcript_65554/m.211450 type:complete len:454 (+) Transcript_65554:70-1431(+)
MADTAAAFEEAKAAGNRAVAAGDFEAADRQYTAALDALQASSPGSVQDAGSLRAVLFCNRSHARQQRGLWQAAVDDATRVLEQTAGDSSASSTKLQVKALYRRALAHEALGGLSDAYLDLNLAAKLAPSNEGIITAARRIREAAPPAQLRAARPQQAPRAWRPEYPFCTKLVLQIADSDQFPGRIRGHTPVDSDAVVKFPNGTGVGVHHADGGLSAIWPLGPPRLLPRCRERSDNGKLVPVRGPPELGDDFFSLPNMRPGDGYHLKYGRGGDLRWIFQYKDGALDGLALRFEQEGFLKYESCGLYRRGRLVEKWQNCLLPDGYLGLVLAEVAVPVKKSLGIGLSPCEKRLCYDNHVDVDGIAPAPLGTLPEGQAPEVPEPMSGQAVRSTEWWRPRLEVADPSLAYTGDSARPGDFAPIGPSAFAPEVCPLLPGEGLPRLAGVVPPREEGDARP